MEENYKQFIAENRELIYKTLKELCAIPAPSHFEQARAEYCKNWLLAQGAQEVSIDKALNVLLPIHCDGSNKITVFAAHTDTVFPDRTPLPYFDDGEKIHSPGVSDDTASVTVLLLAAKYHLQNRIVPKNGILFVLNSCEEGLGNLKGVRQLFTDFEGRIETFISLDSDLNHAVDRAVGSHRYEVTVRTEGGHSFGNFGNRNAIAELSRLISEIYKIKVPEKPGTKTTYNVGMVEGGTSVNTIAQSAKMLCEYRSDDKECLQKMQQAFEERFAQAAETAEIEVKLVGERPCSDIDAAKTEKIKAILTPLIEETLGEKLHFSSGSTDCNIPLSLGVAALCIGANRHANVHTRSEWVDKESLKTGLLITLKAIHALTTAE